MIPSPFQELTAEQALDLVRNNMAFTGDFADWVANEISTGAPRIFALEIAPIRLTRPILGFKRKTRLRFTFDRSSGALLRFRNTDQTPDVCRLDELGQEAIVIVNNVGAQNAGVTLTV